MLSYPGCGYICLNSTWCDATGLPLVSKMRKRELVVPLSMEPTKTSSPACFVSKFVLLDSRQHSCTYHCVDLVVVRGKFAVVGISLEKDSVNVTEFGSRGKADERQKQKKKTRKNMRMLLYRNTVIQRPRRVWDVTSFGLVAHWDGIAGNPSRVGFSAMASHVNQC